MHYPEPEVFPVRVRANGAEIWFVWECVDVGSCLWNAGGAIVMAGDRSGILAELESADRSAHLGSDCYFDLDGAWDALRHRADFDPEEVVDLWNLLTDIYQAGTGRRGRFHADLSGTYESFFSRCEVGAAVGMDTEIISGADVACAIGVLEDGLAMIGGLRRPIRSGQRA